MSEVPLSELPAPSLARAMLIAQAEQRSGIFEVKADGARTRVYFAKGKVVFADQGSLGDTLGRILVREGKLTTHQYTSAIGRMKERLAEGGNEQMRFGEALVELGLLKGEEVYEALDAQVRHRAVRCLMYDEPEWTFRESAEAPPAVHFPSRVEPLILAAAKLFEQERIDRILEIGQERYPYLLADAATLALPFKMSGPEQAFLQRVDGVTPVRALLGSKVPGFEDAEAVLVAVVVAGVAELGAQPTAPSAALSLPAPGGSAQVERMPAPRVPRPARARAPAGSSAATKSPPEAASVSVPTPFDPMMPMPANPHAARLEAERAFQKASMHLQSHALGRALPELRRAATFCPDSTEFALYLTWAEFLANRNDEGSTARREGLRQLASKAVKQDPNLAFGFFVLGQIALLAGAEATLPVRLFRHALKLDPNLRDAARHLEVAEQRAAKGPAGAVPAGSEDPAPREASSSVVEFIVSSISQPPPPPEPPWEPEAPTIRMEIDQSGGTKESPAALRRSDASPSDDANPPTEANPQAAAEPAEAAPAPAQGFPLTPRPASSLAAPPPPEPSRPEYASAAPESPAGIPSRAGHVARSIGPLLAALAVIGIGVASFLALVQRPGATADSTSPGSGSSPPNDRPRSTASAAPSSHPSTLPPEVSAREPSSPAPVASPSPRPPIIAPPATELPAATTNVDPKMGTVQMPASANGHRIFVDGRVVSEGAEPLVVRCGAHVLKVGSAGRERPIVVPCGGTVAVEP